MITLARYTDQELLDLIQQKATEFGRTPRVTEMEVYKTILRRFGSWKKALNKLELKPFGKESMYTDEELLNILREEKCKLGRIPKYVEVKQGCTIRRRFGSWRAALVKSGLQPTKSLEQS